MSFDRQLTITTPRNFKVVSQLVCVTAIDFESRSFKAFTEISFLPLTPQLRNVKFNFSKQCHIHRVTVQETIDVAFIHEDPVSANLNSLSSNDSITASSVYSALSSAAAKIDSERGNGELTVKFPSEIYSLIDEQKLIRIGIDYMVKQPSAGVHFVCSSRSNVDADKEQQQQTISVRERGWHVYTSKTSDYQARCWLPCVDAPGELCPWKIEITCDAAMTAVCSGELVEVVYTTDLRRKTFCYVLPVPTSACHIGFAVGPFDVYVHPEMNELSNFCLPQLLPLLKIVCRNLHKTFEFYEELLSARYPYGSYKQVFVDDCPSDLISYSSLSIFSIKLLYHQKVIEQPPLTRAMMANAIAQQFFGCFVGTASWRDFWVCNGIASYIGALYVQRFFGNNEYTYQIYETLREVLAYETQHGGIVLLPPVNEKSPENDRFHFDIRCPLTCSPAYTTAMAKKAHLIFRMMEKKLGKELLLQVLNKLLSVATHGSQQRYQPAMWFHLLLSTDSFFKCVSNVTGEDLQSFLEQWIMTSGHAEFVVSFNFNRKRNMIELETRQDLTANGALKYVGPIVVIVQELDGSFTHTLQIDDTTSRHDIQCHSKARRQRKRKIPIWTGEEVDMDLTALDADSPVLWLRFDPELVTISRVQLQQPDYQWQYQLRHERDVLAQLTALEMLPRFPSPQTRSALVDVIDHDQCFYRVRCSACSALSDVSNKLAAAWSGPPPMFTTFKKMFGSKSAPEIPRLNNFSNFQQYFLMKSIVKAVALLRGPNGLCLNDVHQFLFNLLKYNNNSQNSKFYDDGYRACILEALGWTVEPGVPVTPIAMSSMFGTHQRSIQLGSSQLKKMGAEVTLALNLERLKPSYNKSITVASLRALLELYKADYFLATPTLWREFMDSGQYTQVRLTAAECLIQFIKISKNENELTNVLDSLKIKNGDEWDKRGSMKKEKSLNQENRIEIESPAVRWRLIKTLSEKPIFSKSDAMGNSLNKKEVYGAFLDLIINGGLWSDLRLVSALLEAVVIMFGTDEPTFSNLVEPRADSGASGDARAVSASDGEQITETQSVLDAVATIPQQRLVSSVSSTFGSPSSGFGNLRQGGEDDEEMVWEN